MMKKHTKLVRGLTGALSVSALALGLSGNAQAALVTTLDGVQGKISLTSGVSLAAVGSGLTVVYNSNNSGNNGSGVGVSGATASTTMGGAAGPFAPAASINITYSRHNLGSNGTSGNHTPSVLSSSVKGVNNAVVGTNQICVFCHTPHGFNTVQSGPLWNKQVNASSNYTVYNAGSNNSSTLDADTPVIGSVSLACLSCHDGTQAMDNMVNAPGSGGMAQPYDATNSSSVAGGNKGVSQGYIWGSKKSGFAYMSQGGATANGGFTAGGLSEDNPASEGIDLGTDLSNDHPISVQYCGGGISSTQAGSAIGFTYTGTAGIAQGTCRDRLFNLPTTQSLNGSQRFWVDTNVIPDQDAIDAGAASTGGVGANPITRDPNTLEVYVAAGTTPAVNSASTAAGGCGTGNNGDACGRGFISYVGFTSNVGGISTVIPQGTIGGFGVRTKQDIMLFTNNQGVQGPSVECASCHDPHTPNNGTFLRVSNNGSGLCLSCHVK